MLGEAAETRRGTRLARWGEATPNESDEPSVTESYDREEFEQFMREHFGDLDFQVLVCFHATSGDKSLALSEIARMTSSSEASVRAALVRLATRRLISGAALEPAGYRLDRRPVLGGPFVGLPVEFRAEPRALMRLACAGVRRLSAAALRTYTSGFRSGAWMSR
jgi:hypothetical protein